MEEINIPTDTLKLLYNAVSSAVMGLKSILIIVENDKLIVKHINESNSAMMKFESKELNGDKELIKLPIDVADIKTVVGLSKEYPMATFLIDDGFTVCKMGKIKKQFSQPKMNEKPLNDPKFETNTSMEFNDLQAKNIIDIFSDLKEKGDLKITASLEGIKFTVKEDNRSTETSFAPEDVEAYLSKFPAFGGYDLEMAISIFKIKQKGSNLKFEIGKDVPMRITQITNQGTFSIILAPKIFD